METSGEPSNARRRSGWPFKPYRLDKAVGLIIGVAFVLAVSWFLVQFFLGFLSGPRWTDGRLAFSCEHADRIVAKLQTEENSGFVRCSRKMALGR